MFIHLYLLDTTVERNQLIREVYPKLKSHFRQKYGLDFQVRHFR